MCKLLTIVLLAGAVVYGQEATPDHRLKTLAAVLHEMLSAPDRGIPKDLLEKAQCVVVVPGLKKGAFIFGGDYGRGFAVCRSNGAWGGPAAVKFGGGSFRANWRRSSPEDKLTLGGDASVAAGPVGTC